MTDTWIEETLYEDWHQSFRVEREIARVRSEFQDIVVFQSRSHGRVLMLDGVVQITEADEFVYQEMLAHVPLVAHGKARRVLIIGAGRWRRPAPRPAASECREGGNGRNRRRRDPAVA